MMMSQWVINRVGLLNFWYYQKQIFQLSDGKMLLRGSNGSGKSLTMQSLLPVLFDGDTRAYRLDSFGSKDRKMEDYLLGEKGVSSRDEGTGYLFLEVKKEGVEEYLTVGIGMQANRGGKLSKWFFAIENNQRVGINFELYEEFRKGEITPFTKKKLKNRLESIGKLFENQGEYKRYVNDRIFGFETIEQFDELIALLINLRRPKLSKEFNPSVIYNILRDSLPKLKEDELLNLSKTIEQLDGHHERLSDLSLEINNLSKFSKTYKTWSEELLGQVAGKWLKVLSEKRALEKEMMVNQKEKIKLEEDIKQYLEEQQESEQKNTLLLQHIESLNNHEGIDLALRGEELSNELEQLQTLLKQNQERHERKERDLLTQKNQLTQSQNEQEELSKELEELLLDNEQYLKYVHLEELNQTYNEKMRKQLTSAEFVYWKSEIRKRKEYLETVIQMLKELNLKKVETKRLSKERGVIQQEIDNLDKDLRQWQRTRQSEIDRWKETFNNWQKLAPFKLDESSYFESLHRMDQLLEDEYREEFVLEPLRECYHQSLSDKDKEIVPLDQRILELNNEKQQNNSEISEWKNQKTPIIFKNKERVENREKLTGKASFLPFYQGVDFVEGISLEDRNTIEGALMSSGILDSLISNEGLTLFDDLQILPQPKYFNAVTLNDFLVVSKEVPEKLKGVIQDILQSITVDEFDPDQPAIYRDGSYQIANLKGCMAENYQASYIGALSQERYRQEQITLLENRNQEIKEQVSNLQRSIDSLKEEQVQLTQYYKTCPKGENIQQAIIEQKQVQLLKNYGEEKEKQLAHRIQELNLLIKSEEVEIHVLTTQDQLNLDVEEYELARKYTQNYEENLLDSYQVYQRIQAKKETIMTLNQIVERQLEESAEFQEAISDFLIKLEYKKNLLIENHKQQKLLNVEEIQKELTQSKKELRETKIKITQARELGHEAEKKLVLVAKTLEDGIDSLDEKKFVEKNWCDLFKKEAIRSNIEEESLEKFAKNNQKSADFPRLQKLEGNILEQYNYYINDNLTNYSPKLSSSAIIELSGEEEERLGELISYNQRKEPQFSLGEEKCGTFELLKNLKNQRMVLEDLLKKDEEDLFKHFILESVGNILRVRIHQAMKWVEEMNTLLKEQKNSSSLKLSIQWKPTTKSSDQELGTAKLVELLQKPIEILSDADKTAISNHFQEKVKFAQEQVKNSEEGESILFQAITKVLDYRDWFEFELKFQRSNEGYGWQVLSDRRFNQFSGGEKAIVMYLPLFISVYSRYLDAENFCPKVIMLDEAFAGIDDMNIAELFKACEQLGFNYIMNSQALFGTYPTVSSLMIYELLRPQNANLVTAINYHWDGNKKSVLVEGV